MADYAFDHDFGGRTKTDEDTWEAAKFGTLPGLRPISPNERGRILDMIARGIDNEHTRRYIEDNRKRSPIVTPAQRVSRFGGKRGRPRLKFDREKVKLMYTTGMTVKQIADHVGVHTDTVRGWLKTLGVYDPSRDKSGGKGKTRNRKEECSKGHDLTKEENLLWTKDKKTGRKKRECKKCKYLRNAEYKRRRSQSTSSR